MTTSCRPRAFVAKAAPPEPRPDGSDGRHGAGRPLRGPDGRRRCAHARARRGARRRGTQNAWRVHYPFPGLGASRSAPPTKAGHAANAATADAGCQELVNQATTNSWHPLPRLTNRRSRSPTQPLEAKHGASLADVGPALVALSESATEVALTR